MLDEPADRGFQARLAAAAARKEQFEQLIEKG